MPRGRLEPRQCLEDSIPVIIIIIIDKGREVKEGGEGKKGKGRGREMEGRFIRGGQGKGRGRVPPVITVSPRI